MSNWQGHASSSLDNGRGEQSQPLTNALEAVKSTISVEV